MENFEKLPPEKRRGVLNAAFACFGRNGYKKTSMADVAAAAGVSKAALFHYFGTKKALYIYLYRFACGEIIAEMRSGTEDFFESITLGIEIKMRVMKKYPDMGDFMLSSAKETETDLVREAWETDAEKLSAAASVLLANVDPGRFKPGVDPAAAMNLVNWVSEGYLRANAADKSGEEMVTEIVRYLDILKSAIYKEEYL